MSPAPPQPHESGARPPAISADRLPRHVAIVMDGNGRWAKARNLPRTEGHARGEDSLFDVIAGAIEIGVRYLSAYAFSTENWSRSPDEVRWLMGFNRDVIHRRRDQLDAMGVRVRWAGRRPRLWRSVINELEDAERRTLDNDVLTLQFCVNYGGRAEIVDAARRVAELAAAGRLDPAKLTEDRFRQFLDEPDIPDVDLFVRSSGEQRTSNFLLWQSAYAEMVFLDRLWPDFDRRDLWRAIELYANRERRYGGAVPNSTRGGAVPNSTRGGARIPNTFDPRGSQQLSQVPKISRSWLTSRKPCSAATAFAHFSTAGPETSTVRPQLRQTRWWWCPVEQRRYAVSPSAFRSASSSPASAIACRVR